MGKENEIPEKNYNQLETADYADGDLDLGVWEDEIMDIRADDITGDTIPVRDGDYVSGNVDDPAENIR